MSFAEVLRPNKNTLMLLSGKSMVRPCLFICRRNLISESLGVALTSQASSSPSAGLDLGVNPWSPKESPRLSQASAHIYMYLASESPETFHFCVWACAQLLVHVCVCVLGVCVAQKMQKNPQGGFAEGRPDQQTHSSTETKLNTFP